MKKEKIQLDFGTDSITVQQDSGHVFSIALMPDRPTKTALAKTIDSLVIPPQSEYVFPVKINKFQDCETVMRLLVGNVSPQFQVARDFIG